MQTETKTQNFKCVVTSFFVTMNVKALSAFLRNSEKREDYAPIKNHFNISIRKQFDFGKSLR